MKEEIKKFYSNLQFPGRYSIDDLKFYDEHGIHNIYLKEINSIMSGGLTVLDVGCGTGLVSNLFANKYPDSQFTSVDFSDSIDYAKKFAVANKIKNTNWVKTDFLEFNNSATYDVIICCGVLHHIPQHEVALAKMKSLLKPGGKLMLALYNPYGKILKHIINIKYNCDILYQDQENNPFELSFTYREVLSMCSDFKFESVQPSIRNHLVNALALFNSENGGLTTYIFTKP